MDSERNGQVPVRTIAATIGMVLATAAAVWLLINLSRVLVWIIVAAFFAAVLSPIVGFLQRRARMPRPLAAFSGLLAVFAVLAGIITVLVIPVVGAVQPFITQLPQYIEQAQSGEGPIGSLLRRFDVVDRIRDNLDSIRNTLGQLSDPALNAVVAAGNAAVGIVVVLVLSFLLTLQGPQLADQAVGFLPEQHRGRARQMLRDSGRAVTGYVSGQLFIATLCGLLTYLVLVIMGVPFPGVVALFVGLMGLVPAVGATIGGLLAIGVAFLHTVIAGIVVLIFFLVYQQVENHLLQPYIQSRTVHLNALAVLVSVLVGVELLGILGALLAIPAAGIVKVIVNDLWLHRPGARTPASEPTCPARPGSDARGESAEGAREISHHESDDSTARQGSGGALDDEEPDPSGQESSAIT